MSVRYYGDGVCMLYACVSMFQKSRVQSGCALNAPVSEDEREGKHHRERRQYHLLQIRPEHQQCRANRGNHPQYNGQGANDLSQGCVVGEGGAELRHLGVILCDVGGRGGGRGGRGREEGQE